MKDCHWVSIQSVSTGEHTLCGFLLDVLTMSWFLCIPCHSSLLLPKKYSQTKITKADQSRPAATSMWKTQESLFSSFCQQTHVTPLVFSINCSFFPHLLNNCSLAFWFHFWKITGLVYWFSFIPPLFLCSLFLGVCVCAAHFMAFPLAIRVKVEEYSADIFISTCRISLNQKQMRLHETCQHSTTTSDTLISFQNKTGLISRNHPDVSTNKLANCLDHTVL